MKKTIIPAFLTLVAGFLLGGLLPNETLPQIDIPSPYASSAADIGTGVVSEQGTVNGEANTDGASSAASSAVPAVTFNPKDSGPLLSAALNAVYAMRDMDYDKLASLVHPDGVTITPYSTVDPSSDLTLTRAQIRELESDTTVYTWGLYDGRGEPIQMPIKQFFSEFVFSVDYSLAPEFAVDRILMSGNALENLPEVYSDCRFVDFCYPGIDPSLSGLDWCSLKLVFRASETQWQLVGIIHSQWTI